MNRILTIIGMQENIVDKHYSFHKRQQEQLVIIKQRVARRIARKTTRAGCILADPLYHVPVLMNVTVLVGIFASA
jgi:hypothetical protein